MCVCLFSSNSISRSLFVSFIRSIGYTIASAVPFSRVFYSLWWLIRRHSYIQTFVLLQFGRPSVWSRYQNTKCMPWKKNRKHINFGRNVKLGINFVIHAWTMQRSNVHAVKNSCGCHRIIYDILLWRVCMNQNAKSKQSDEIETNSHWNDWNVNGKDYIVFFSAVDLFTQ